MKVVVLGSGTSHGVPVPGCGCPVCLSDDSRDKRLRASVYLEGAGGERAVIDTGPEFRIQALRAGIKKLDAVFLTHAHADHLHGLDDIRPFSPVSIPVYGNSQTLDEFRERFAYIFKKTQQGGGKPRIETRPVSAGQKISLGNIAVTAVPVKHGALDIFGWKILENPQNPAENNEKSFVYLTDVSKIPETSFTLIAEDGKPGLLVIDGLRQRPHETHFTFEQAFEAAARIGARQTYITHICHSHFHREIETLCREFTEKQKAAGRISPAWDGLEVELPGKTGF
ncbi:MAG: MBL fold metallo-hydrolase [Treponema sp.]|nr:MBL fold metallo-hydrolase [Treponema sp.]